METKRADSAESPCLAFPYPTKVAHPAMGIIEKEGWSVPDHRNAFRFHKCVMRLPKRAVRILAK